LAPITFVQLQFGTRIPVVLRSSMGVKTIKI
jgi:hypothetical protein